MKAEMKSDRKVFQAGRIALTLSLAVSVGQAARAQTTVSSGARFAPPVPAVRNLETSSFLGPAVGRGLVAFLVSEFQEGSTDLNGDGDAYDYVLHVHDLATGETTNLGLTSFAFDVDGPVVAFLVDEGAQGNTDLNNDGDAFDQVAHVFEGGPDEVTNLGLATGLETVGPRVSGNLIAIPVEEFAQGETDLNGDGDTLDMQVLHVHDVGTGVTTNLGLATGFFGSRGSGSLIAVPVTEFDHGQADLNGDADIFDTVLHVYDASEGVVVNTGLATSFGSIQIDGTRVLCGVAEPSQGQTDFNGDGDSTDEVAVIFDTATRTVTNLQLALASGTPHISGGFVVLPVSEDDQGQTDLNGDGDILDRVEHVHDLTKGSTVNLGLASEGALFDGTIVAFRVWESGNGFTDLNHDTDTDDIVVHVHNVATGVTRNLSLAAEFDLRLSRNLLAFRVSELGQNATDLNGDGDTADKVLHVFDALTGIKTNLARSPRANGVQIDRRRVAFEVNETFQGNADLNGDGDAFDDVLHAYDARNGAVVNLGFAVDDFRLSRRGVVFEVCEGSQSKTDLNGDGDVFDLDVSEDARLIPAVVRLSWRGPNGDMASAHPVWVQGN